MILKIWNGINDYLNTHDVADISANLSVSGAAMGIVHFSDIDFVLKSLLTCISIVFVIYRIFSHHEDRTHLKNERKKGNSSTKVDSGL